MVTNHFKRTSSHVSASIFSFILVTVSKVNKKVLIIKKVYLTVKTLGSADPCTPSGDEAGIEDGWINI